MNERNRENFVLNEAKNAGDAQASARLFNEVQEKIYRLQPFNVLQNKSNIGDRLFIIRDLGKSPAH